jgi:hypothetical protein
VIGFPTRKAHKRNQPRLARERYAQVNQMSRIKIILIILLFASCNSTEQRIINRFNNNRILFDQLKSKVFEDKALINNLERFTNVNKLEEKTVESLDKLGIPNVSYLILSKNSCPDSKEYAIEIIFGGNWHLEYLPCDKRKIIKGSHTKDGFIESWGLDNHWILWINHDVIG